MVLTFTQTFTRLNVTGRFCSFLVLCSVRNMDFVYFVFSVYLSPSRAGKEGCVVRPPPLSSLSAVDFIISRRIFS